MTRKYRNENMYTIGNLDSFVIITHLRKSDEKKSHMEKKSHGWDYSLFIIHDTQCFCGPDEQRYMTPQMNEKKKPRLLKRY